jgi:hypothetical protein
VGGKKFLDTRNIVGGYRLVEVTVIGSEAHLEKQDITTVAIAPRLILAGLMRRSDGLRNTAGIHDRPHDFAGTTPT